MSDLLAAALAYAARGWRVFPCQPRSKFPRAGSHGCLDATTDEALIRAWWTADPECNVAIATGPDSELYVLDVDCSEGKVGQASIDALTALYGPLPETPLQQTGGGGWQHLLAYPPVGEWPNTASAIGQHLDTRGAGGYVIVPPSIHPNGNAYRWAEFVELQPAAMPGWLTDVLAKTSVRKAAPANPSGLWPEGQRNDRLARHAGKLRRMGLSEQVMEAALLALNRERCNPPLDGGEVAKIAASIAKYQPDPLELDTLDPEIMDHGDQVAALLMASPSGLPQFPFRSHEERLKDRTAKPDMLIEDVLTIGGVGVIAAMPGVGKTLIAIHLARCVAGAELFLGKKTALGRVLYCCPDSPASTERRMLALPDVAAKGILSVCEMPPMPGSIGMLAETVKTLADCKLVVIDTYDSARDHAGGGYSEQDGLVEQILGALRRMAAELRVSVVLVHHATRSDGGRTRGSLVFDARADWIAIADMPDGSDRLTLTTTKSRDGERGALGAFRIVEVDVAGGVPVLEEIGIGANQKAPSDDVTDLERKVVLALVNRDPALGDPSARALAEVAGVSFGSLTKIVQRLRAEGLIEVGLYRATPTAHLTIRPKPPGKS